MNLIPGTLLYGGKYRIIKVLGRGGFGITYLGEQIYLGRKVAIKEFFMEGLCVRHNSTSDVYSPVNAELVKRFRTKFVKEARNIAQLKHPNIVQIMDIFEQNDTAYYVMEYLEGGSLLDKVAGGAIDEKLALKYIREVASALTYIHSHKMMHLDVKPANIILDRNDNAVLIDFGLAKQYDNTGQQTSTTPVGISHGYAPIEQYKQEGVNSFTPATDIYSLGATLFKLVTGATPPEISHIMNKGTLPFTSNVSVNVQNAIIKAMKPAILDRPQSVDEFLSIIGDCGAEQKTPKVRRWPFVLALSLVSTIAIVLLVLYITESHSKNRYRRTSMRQSTEISSLYNKLETAEEKIESSKSELSEFKSEIGETFPMIITSIDIGNVDYENNMLTNYGSAIYSYKTRYLKPRIKYTGIKSGTVTLKVKWRNSSGGLRQGSNSPSDASFTQDVYISQGKNNTFYFTGWGNNNDGNWSAGTYYVEIWYKDVCLKSRRVTIY